MEYNKEDVKKALNRYIEIVECKDCSINERIIILKVLKRFCEPSGEKILSKFLTDLEYLAFIQIVDELPGKFPELKIS